MPRSDSSRLFTFLHRRYDTPFLGRVSTYVENLSPGDKSIASLLAAVIVGASLLSIYALEQKLTVQVPAHGGTLTEGVVGSARFVNPLLAITDADRDLATLTFAGLMGTDKAGALVPVLAKSYTVSPDGKVYTFTLRDNVRFSDGTSITADDVVFTIGKAQDPALKSPELANWTNIRVEAVDARTVRFTLPKPYAPFLEDATLGILPAHLWKNISDTEFPFSPLMEKPVGAGPLKVTKVSRDSQGVVNAYELSAYSGYALGRPYLNGINFQFFDNQTDLASALSHDTIESAYGIARPGALTAPYARVFGVFFNPISNSLFAHAEVRKALSLAIDRTQLVNDALGGYATALAGPVPPGSGADPVPLPTGDGIAAAAATLKNAGWTYATSTNSWRQVKQKMDLTVTLKTSNVPELKTVAQAIKADWEKLGVPTSLELYDPNDLTQTVIRPRAYEALLFGEVVGHSQDLYAFWDSAERNDPGLNIALYTNHDVDALIEKARTEADPTVRARELTKINQLIAADYPAAFTHSPDFVYSIPKDLHGVVLLQIASPSDRFATVATWYRYTESVWPFLAYR